LPKPGKDSLNDWPKPCRLPEYLNRQNRKGLNLHCCQNAGGEYDVEMQ